MVSYLSEDCRIIKIKDLKIIQNVKYIKNILINKFNGESFPFTKLYIIPTKTDDGKDLIFFSQRIFKFGSLYFAKLKSPNLHIIILISKSLNMGISELASSSQVICVEDLDLLTILDYLTEDIMIEGVLDSQELSDYESCNYSVGFCPF